MKKLIALVLSLVLALSLCVVSWGASPADVVDNGDGTVSVYGLTLKPDGANSKIIVSDKDGFLNLTMLFENWTALFTDGNGNEFSNYANGAGGDYYYGHRWTISLEADIDLNNATIDPVTIKHPLQSGAPSFEGNNHTIKNAKIVTDAATENEAGLFNASGVSFKDLKLDNIHVTGSNIGNSTAGVLAGSVTADQGVQNITITNSSVTNGKYTGGVVGYGYTDVLNCTLTNVTVKGGYKLGGLIGYICASSGNGDVTGNTLTDCTVDGIGGGVYAGGKTEYVIGKLVGNYNCDGDCGSNVVTDMTSSVTELIGKTETGWTVDNLDSNTVTTTPAPTPTPTPSYPVYVPAVDDTTEKDVTSAQTFDAGIALYVGVSVMGAVGTVALSKKRED